MASRNGRVYGGQRSSGAAPLRTAGPVTGTYEEVPMRQHATHTDPDAAS
jgi:hypothetical protein